MPSRPAWDPSLSPTPPSAAAYWVLLPREQIKGSWWSLSMLAGSSGYSLGHSPCVQLKFILSVVWKSGFLHAKTPSHHGSLRVWNNSSSGTEGQRTAEKGSLCQASSCMAASCLLVRVLKRVRTNRINAYEKGVSLHNMVCAVQQWLSQTIEIKSSVHEPDSSAIPRWP